MTSVTIGNGVTEIGEFAFTGCSSLTSAIIGNSVTSIGTGAFYRCERLTSVTFPNIISIGYRAFEYCYALTSVTIGNGVTSIGKQAFDGCNRLADVYCHATEIPTTEEYAFSSTNFATLHVPATSLEAYKTTYPWSSFGNIVALTDDETDVEQLTIANEQLTIQDVYDLNGRLQTKMQKGINIIRNSNGTMKKVMVK